MGEPALIIMVLNIFFKNKSINLAAIAYEGWCWNALLSPTPPRPSKIQNPRKTIFNYNGR